MSQKKIRAPTSKDILLDETAPNMGVFYWYRKKLHEAIKAMHKDYLTRAKEAFRDNKNILASDSLPSDLETSLSALNAKLFGCLFASCPIS